MMNRRHFLIRSLMTAGAASLATGFYTWKFEPHWLEFVTRRLPVRGLPRSLFGATLAQLSDLHVGLQVADSYILETFRRVAALKPDIVVFTGDLTSYHADVFAHAEDGKGDCPLLIPSRQYTKK